MADTTVKVMRCIQLAKRVNHYYWEHVADAATNMRVQNLEQIVSWMVRLPIKKWSVKYEGGGFIRGLYERYADRIEIYIREGQSEEWIRFTIVKELCHALIDEPSDFSPKGHETIQGLIKYAGVMHLDELTSDVLQSERLAEITALELIYPLEYRRADLARLKEDKIKVADLVKVRAVPSPWIQRALNQEHIEACEYFWKTIADEELPELLPL